jgi:hypothetical protein
MCRRRRPSKVEAAARQHCTSKRRVRDDIVSYIHVTHVPKFHQYRQMVNVTSEIPFNLHNKPLPALDPSSSRSVSVSTNSQSPSTPIRHHRKVRIRSPLQRTPSHSAEPSPARSRSKSSSKEEDDADGLEEHAHPILNVRLVRGCPPGYGAMARRGRALVRAGGGHLDGMFEREESGDSGKGKERAQDVTEHGQGGSPLDGDEQVGLGTVGDGVNHAGPGDAHRASSESFISEPVPRGQDVCNFQFTFRALSDASYQG